VTRGDEVVLSTDDEYVGLARDGGLSWRTAPERAGIPLWRAPLVDEGRFPGTLLPNVYENGATTVIVSSRASDGFMQAAVESQDAGSFGTPDVIGVDSDGAFFVSAREGSGAYSLSERSPGLHERWRVPARELEYAPLASESGDRLVTVDRQCRVNLLDRRTGATLASHRMVGRPARFLPRLLGGVLYLVAEVRPAQTVKPSEMQGRVRPDGGVIDVADYGCYLPAYLDSGKCPPVSAASDHRFFALYAFQVE